MREALRTLETQGFIQIKKGSGGGAFIGNTDPGILPSIIMDNLLLDGLTSDLMTEARTALECAIVKSAIEHGTEEDLTRISRHIEQSQPITEPERTELLLREMKALEFHKKLYRAIERKDVPLAQKLVREHTEHLGRMIAKWDREES